MSGERGESPVQSEQPPVADVQREAWLVKLGL